MRIGQDPTVPRGEEGRAGLAGGAGGAATPAQLFYVAGLGYQHAPFELNDVVALLDSSNFKYVLSKRFQALCWSKVPLKTVA